MTSIEATSVVNVNSEIKGECDVTIDSCRICMARNTKMEHLFDTEPDSISDRILFCTGVQFRKEDDLPTQICEACLNNLSITHKFKRQCLLADETFQKLVISKYIKTEAPDSDHDHHDDYVDLIQFYDDKVDNETKVKDEIMEVLTQNHVRKSGRLKKEKNDSKLEIEMIPTKPGKKRGPYNKTGIPKRLRKLKFSRLKCEVCDLKFATKEESNEHKKVVHKSNENWICEICGKVFIHQGSHYTHIRSHMPPQYGCEQCDYKTQHKHDLVKHVRIHTGIKLYQCEFCSASYHTSSNLSGHIRRFHEGVKRFQCHMCDRRFFDRTKLNRHLDSHNDIKRFECEVCHSCFTRRCYWKKHLQRQHGVVVPAQRPGRQKVNLLIGDAKLTRAPQAAKFGN